MAKKIVECRVEGKGRIFCSGTVRFVVLGQTQDPGNQNEVWSNTQNFDSSEIPEEIGLCERHHQELNEKGILTFFKSYGLNEVDELDEELPHERHMTYLDPGVLEGVANARKPMEASGGYGCVPGYEELRQTNIVLEELPLTDKQLMAVCLVFYGGIKKKSAARAMKISAQALSDHIKAALKKIKGKLFQ